MTGKLDKLREAVIAFDRTGRFAEEDYQLLREVLVGRIRARGELDVVDGWVHLFFERHVLHRARRAELLALDPGGFERAVRHRFKQVLSDEREDHRAYHALSAHVREALESLTERPEMTPAAPISLMDGDRFSPERVRAAVMALWNEGPRKPTVPEATEELMRRYLAPGRGTATGGTPASEQLPRQLDAQRLSAAILNLLNEAERSLLRHVLVEEGTADSWAKLHAVSRATAYRLLARLKTLCQLELEPRTSATRLEAMQELARQLVS